MLNPANEIARRAQNCSFDIAAIKEFLYLLGIQKNNYTEIDHLANGKLSLILKAKKLGITEKVSLKVIQVKQDTFTLEAAMKRERTIISQFPQSNCFIRIKEQFYLTRIEVCKNSLNVPTEVNRFFVQEIELCSDNLQDIFRSFQLNKTDIFSELFKETLAIQMIDAINFLHFRQMVHRKIQPSKFLLQPGKNFPFVLKLCDIGFVSLANLTIEQKNLMSKNDNTDKMVSDIQNNQQFCIESDLFQLGIILIQLDNISTFDITKVTSTELCKLHEGNIFDNHKINRNSLIFQIASTFLQKQPIYTKSAQSMLLKLIDKSEEHRKIPVFSIILKETLEYYPWLGLSLSSLTKTQGNQLSSKIIISALRLMFEWKEFKGVFDLLSINETEVIFGVENILENRKSLLKLQLCANKSTKIHQIGLMKICQSPYIQQFHSHRFFEDAEGNQFLVFELERCAYSLANYLEQQTIQGEEFSAYQKQNWMLQIMDSVNYLHQNSILHGSIELDKFYVSLNAEGQVTVKQTDFSQAASLQNWFLYEKTQPENAHPWTQHCSHLKQNPSSLIFTPPERWGDMEKINSITKQTDCYSLGMCLILLDNYSVSAAEKLQSLKFTTVPELFPQFLIDTKGISIDQSSKIFNIAKNLLQFLPKQRKSLLSLMKRVSIPSCCLFSQAQDYPFSGQISHQTMYFNNNNIQKSFQTKGIQYLGNLLNLQIIFLNLERTQIGDAEAMSLLSPLSNLTNLTSLSLCLQSNLIGHIGGKQLLLPIEKLLNLRQFSLDLRNNLIGDLGSEVLLHPLEKLKNLTCISLSLQGNSIGSTKISSFLYPLSNSINLTNISLNLKNNQIQDTGAEFLLSPLEKLKNLQSFYLNLQENSIGDIGASDLLQPLSGIFSLTTLSLNLSNNYIGDIGAKSLLIPITNLVNLSRIYLQIESNDIQKKGAQNLFSPLTFLKNLEHLFLNLQCNAIKDVSKFQLLSHLAELPNLLSISLVLQKGMIIKSNSIQKMLFPLSCLSNLVSVDINLSLLEILITQEEYILSSFSTLFNLQILLLNLSGMRITCLEAKSLLIPLKDLQKLSVFDLDLQGNQIQDMGAQSLLLPLTNLTCLSNLSLNLNQNSIGSIGLKCLLSPLSNLTNLTSFCLGLSKNNQILDEGVQQLLQPLEKCIKLVRISLNLAYNKIRYNGAQNLLLPLTHLINLQQLSLDLEDNLISHMEIKPSIYPRCSIPNPLNCLVQCFKTKPKSPIQFQKQLFILSPLNHLINLQRITLNLQKNQIRDNIAQILLEPLSNLINLETLSLDLAYNLIGNVGAQYLLSQSSNIVNLKNIKLNFYQNPVDKQIEHLSKRIFTGLESIDVIDNIFIDI